ncbi:helix-turn-helix domain-containing protein [Wukongibacter sp. M2B1]|uniref:helix-turn-helix domain-containing protein n=1 Tax=Wukongibacter sp. M2B1 TaxID=3088895 RepID=UPI003D79270D
MCFGNLLKGERKRRGLTQEQLKRLLNCSQSDISEWESGKREVPMDIKKKLPHVLNSSRLRMEMINELKVDFINTPFYNGVKFDLLRLIAKNIEEEEESIKASNELFKIVLNNMTEQPYKDNELEKIYELMEQIGDPIGWKRMLFAKVDEQTGANVSRETQKRIDRKIRNKKYVVQV